MPPPQSGWLRPHEPKLNVVFRLLDAFLISIAHYGAVLVWNDRFESEQLAATGIAVAAFWIVGEANGLYVGWRGFSLRSEIVQGWMAWFGAAALLLIVGFLTKTTAQFSRVVSTTWFATAPLALALFRLALRSSLREARRRGYNRRRAAICGMTALGERLALTIEESPWLGLEVRGFYDDRSRERCHPAEIETVGLEGTLDDLISAARKGEVDVVYIAFPLRAEPRVRELVRKLADTTASVYVAADFLAFDLLHSRWKVMGEIPVVSVHDTPFDGVDGWLKRVEDVVLGTIILCIISVPMLIIAAAIRLTSKGPIFFRQRRYGLNGEVIDVLKFRTMRVAEDGDKIQQATRNDPRITPLGAFLRRTSLDELPQFLHVLTGSMSIVGPRPHAVAHNELYRKKIQGYMLRHKVKPGITGWAQINGWRGETDTLEKMEKRVEHDLDYIRNWDLLLDLKIIWKTVFGSDTRKNAF